jgi:folate-dependent phosphoribosylglycinamide formyltransferase PurN
MAELVVLCTAYHSQEIEQAERTNMCNAIHFIVWILNNSVVFYIGFMDNLTATFLEYLRILYNIHP